MVRFLRAALTGEKVKRGLRHVHGERLQARHRARAAAARSSSPRCARGCCGSPGARATAPSSTGSPPTTCRTVVPARARGRRRQGGRGPHLRGADHRRRRSCGTWAASRSPPTSPSPCTPSSTAGSAAARCCSRCGTHWAAGDRKAALEAIPDSLVDALIVHGSPEECREHIGRYIENGVTTPALAILPFGLDPRQAIRDLAPR